MPTGRSIASILIFVGSLLCFFLPFATVSCSNEKLITLTGQQMATGTTIQSPAMLGESQKRKTDANPFALTAMICAAAGIGLTLLGRRMAAAPAAAGAVGAVSLFLMRATMDSEIQRQSLGMVISVSYEYGYIVALVLLIAGAGWNIFLLTQKRPVFVPVMPPPPYPR
jgi:hypothetical protein